MKYLRCKCGKREARTTMGHPDCDGCDVCKTTLEESPSLHREIAEHRLEERWRIDEKTGRRWLEAECSRCHFVTAALVGFFVNGERFVCSQPDLTGAQLRAFSNVDPSSAVALMYEDGRPIDYSDTVHIEQDMRFRTARLSAVPAPGATT